MYGRMEVIRPRLHASGLEHPSHVDGLSVQVYSAFDCDGETHNDGLWAAPLHMGHGMNGLDASGILLRLFSAPNVGQPLGMDNTSSKVYARVGCFYVYKKDDLRKLGWDGEWSLETATQLVIV